MAIAPSDMALLLCWPSVVSHGAIGTRVESRTRGAASDVVPICVVSMGRKIVCGSCKVQVRELDSLGRMTFCAGVAHA